MKTSIKIMLIASNPKGFKFLMVLPKINKLKPTIVLFWVVFSAK